MGEHRGFDFDSEDFAVDQHAIAVEEYRLDHGMFCSIPGASESRQRANSSEMAEK